MANNRISTQEIAEILIKNIGKLEQTNIAIERTAKNITEQIKTVSGSVLKVEKPDVSYMKIIIEEFQQNQHRFLNHNKSLLNEVSELKNKSKLRLPNSVIYVLIGFSLLCIGFVFFSAKTNTYNELKKIRKERDYYLNVLQQIPKKERDKYIKK
jgi:hypothetical protein